MTDEPWRWVSFLDVRAGINSLADLADMSYELQ